MVTGGGAATERHRDMRSARVACHVQLIGGIAFTTLASGVVTPLVLMDVCGQTSTQLHQPPLLFVADFRRVTWALRVTDLDAMYDDSGPEVGPPAALVVLPEAYGMFKAHAWNVAQGGVLRKVFTDYPAAVAWALTRLRLVSPARTVP